MKAKRVFAAVLASAVAAAAPLTQAQAAELLFSGTATATSTGALDPTCAPLIFRSIVNPANSSGWSNLGAFTYSSNSCTQGQRLPNSAVDGIFGMEFANGTFFGTLSGLVTPRAGVPGLFDAAFDYVIGGGSGIFLGASGTFSNLGTIDVRGGPPSRIAFNFEGTINAPAVPEPDSWLLMIVGFFAAGAALRRGRKESVPVFYPKAA